MLSLQFFNMYSSVLFFKMKGFVSVEWSNCVKRNLGANIFPSGSKLFLLKVSGVVLRCAECFLAGFDVQAAGVCAPEGR